MKKTTKKIIGLAKGRIGEAEIQIVYKIIKCANFAICGQKIDRAKIEKNKKNLCFECKKEQRRIAHQKRLALKKMV